MTRHEWRAEYFQSDSVEQRRAIIVSLARTLEHPWFFADLTPQLLEVGIRDGMAHAGERQPSPRIMTRDLFPRGVVPQVYGEALVAMSKRAAELIGRQRDDEQAAVGELDAVYRACFPRVSDRCAAAAWHAEWLRSKAGDSEAGLHIESGGAPPFDEGIARRIRASAYRTTEAGQLSNERRRDATLAAAASLVARLTHIHTLRLLEGQPERAWNAELTWTTWASSLVS
jgi:hypothetical protein